MSRILIADLPRSVRGYCSDASSYLHSLGYRLDLPACIERRNDELRSIQVRIGACLVSSAFDIVSVTIDGPDDQADQIADIMASDCGGPDA